MNLRIAPFQIFSCGSQQLSQLLTTSLFQDHVLPVVFLQTVGELARLSPAGIDEQVENHQQYGDILSMGPAILLADRGAITFDTVGKVYLPVIWTAKKSSHFTDFMEWYLCDVWRWAPNK